MHVLKIIGKVLAWIVGIIFLLLLLIVVAIQLPAVQNRLLAYAEPTIEDLLGGADVEIGHINLDFFDAAEVEDIYIADQRGDTLLYAREFGADIGVFSLLGGEIFVDEIRLDGAVVNAYQLEGDSASNYQFILDAFAPADTVAADTSAAAFDFGLRTVDITDTRIRLLDEVAGTDLRFEGDRLLVNVDAVNLEDLAVDIADVAVRGIDLSFEVSAVDPVAEELAETSVDTSEAGTTVVTFPYAGLPVTVGELLLEDVNVRYVDENTERVPGGLDAGNVEIVNLGALATGFAWDSTRIALDWDELSFRERSGLAVEQLAFGLEVGHEALTLDGFAFATDVSQVLAKAELDYASFADLVALDPATEVNLVLDESYVALSDVKLLAPTLADAGLNLDARGNIYADGRIAGDLRALQLEAFNLRVGQQTAIALGGTIRNPLDPEALAYDVQLGRLTSSYADLNRLTQGLEIPAELADFGRFTLSGSLAGTTTTFTGRKLDLRTDGRTGFRGDLALRNLDDPDNLYIDADVRELRTDTEELAGFIPDSLGVDVQALGEVDFAGTFRGTVTDFELDGVLDTDAGSARADIAADFNADYTDGTYVGSLALDSFNVGALLQDSAIGTLTMDVNVDGSGLSPEAIASSFDGTIQSFTYNGYTYTDITADGDFDQQQFLGRLAIDDENVKFDFEGLVSLRDTLPTMVFRATLDTAALQPLGFYPTPLGTSMSIVANLRGNNADNLTGKLLINDFYLQDSTDFASLDSLRLLAGDTTRGRFLLLTSPLVDAGIVGDYNTADLPALLINYVNDFFPLDAFLSPVDAPSELALEPEPTAEPERVYADQSFDFYVGVSDPTKFAQLFDAGLDRLDTASFTGTFDSGEKVLDARLYIPGLEIAGTVVDTIEVGVGGDVTQMLVDLRTAGVAVAGQEIEIAVSNLRLGDEAAALTLAVFAEEPDSMLLSTGMRVTMNEEGRYVATLTDDLVVAEQTWTVDDGNRIEYIGTYLDVKDLVFRKDGQSIAIRSDDASADDDVAPITVTIDDYRLAEVARLVQLEGFSLEGLVDGTIGIREPTGNLHYLADLTVSDIVLNDEPVGTLVASASSDDLEDQVVVDVRLNGPVNDVAVAGTYGLSDGALDIAADVRAFELRVIDPVATGVLTNSTGLLTADLDIGGIATAPSIQGFVGFDDAASTFELLGVRLFMDDDRVTLSESLIDFGDFTIEDRSGRVLTVSGDIAHDYFADFAFDLNVQTDRFRVLDTEPTLEELYYGTALVSADIDIAGSLEIPEVTGQVEAFDSTQLVLVPLLTTAGVSQEDWVIYADPTSIEQDTAQQLEDVYTANALGLDLALTILVDPEVELDVIVDPTNGDRLVAHGGAEMQVNMTPDGDLSVTGRYEIEYGSYQFTLPIGVDLVQRDFLIRQGSYMNFVGDPLDSRFNITAVYTTETEVQPLLDKYGSASASPESSAAQQRQEVNVLMKMAGTLDEPEITLDIEIPEARGGAASETQRALASVRAQPNELYTQVFGLLTLGGFVGGQATNSPDAAGVAKNAAISSLSGLVSNQLNSLADNLVGGAFDINVGLESYENAYSSQRQTQGTIDLSRSLFNDRITISVGTSVNVGEQQPTALDGQASAVQANFVITYKITEDGHYLFKVFRRPDFDVISAAGFENGVGVSYQRQFD